MSERESGQGVSVTERSQEQAAHEAALAEVEDTILNIETAIRRAERAEATLRSAEAGDKLIDVVARARRELVAVRRRLQQGAYLAAEETGEYMDQVAMFEIEDEDGRQPPLL